jgi:hypothetical protein
MNDTGTHETRLTRAEAQTMEVVERGVPTSLAYTPRNLDEVKTMAKIVAESGVGPAAWRNPNAGTVMIISALELGLTLGQAMRGMWVLDGKLGMESDLLAALVHRNPDCQYFRCVESTAERAIFETKRRGEPEPVRLTYTIEDAQKAGLLAKATYKSHPAPMLAHRAAGRLAKLVYPDSYFGILAGREDNEPSDHEDVRGEPGTPAAPAPAAKPDVPAAKPETKKTQGNKGTSATPEAAPARPKAAPPKPAQVVAAAVVTPVDTNYLVPISARNDPDPAIVDAELLDDAEPPVWANRSNIDAIEQPPAEPAPAPAPAPAAPAPAAQRKTRAAAKPKAEQPDLFAPDLMEQYPWVEAMRDAKNEEELLDAAASAVLEHDADQSLVSKYRAAFAAKFDAVQPGE